MGKMQLEKGQVVVYGTNGICVIEEIKQMKIMMDSKPEPYYVLRPKSNDQSTVFVPVGNEHLTSKIRDLMSKESILSMLRDSKSHKMKWDSDRRARTERFRDILAGGVSEELLEMVICLYERKKSLLKEGKRLPVTDSNTLKSAVKLLEEEVSFVLGIKPEEVGQFIRNELGISGSLD